MTLTPIALFVYNRPEHTKKTVEALLKNILASESELFIFSDGYKNESDKNAVMEVRKFIKTISGFKSIQIIERPENWGLAKSIISGVTEIVNKHGRIIVLEDDLVTSPYFLKYMNEALDMYENEELVISVHGYIYPVKEILPETFFLRGADCWGWATWKRGWGLFESDGQKLLGELVARKLTKKFDLDDVYPYTQMLKGQIEGLNDSWAIRWYASAFLKDKLTLYPGRTLVSNIGFDDSGTHAGKVINFEDKIFDRPLVLERIPIVENNEALESIKKYFSTPRLKMMTLLIRFKFHIKLLCRRLKK